MKYITIIFTILLVGCTTKLERVEVPVYSCPKPDIPEKQVLPVDKITDTTSDMEVLKAYGQSIDMLRLENESLRTILKSYN